MQIYEQRTNHGLVDLFGHVHVQSHKTPNPGKCEGGIAGWVLTNRDDSSLERGIKAGAEHA